MTQPLVTENYFELIEALQKVADLPQVMLIRLNDYEKAEIIHKAYLNRLNETGEQIEDVRLHGTEAGPNQFHSELSTIPMFGGIRLLWVHHGDSLMDKINANDTLKGYFARDFENIPASTKLIFHLDDKKYQGVFNSLKSKAWIFEEKPLREKDLPNYIKTVVRQMDFEIESDAILDLSNKYSMNMERLNDALNRLFTYCIHEKKIFVKDVKEICFDVEGDAIYNILDFIADKKISRAIEIMVNQKITDGGLFLNLLSKMFIDAFRAKYLRLIGKGVKEIHENLGLNIKHAFILRKNEERFNKISTNYHQTQNKILMKLVELDKNLKEGLTPHMQKNLLLTFLISLDHPRMN